MRTDIVFTNLRVSQTDWLQIKVAAAEAGMSVNSYINYLIKAVIAKNELAETKTTDKDLPVWQLANIAGKKSKSRRRKLSADDKIIYS